MLKKSLSFLLLFFLVGSMFTACGKNTELSEEETEGTSESSVISSDVPEAKNDDADDYQNQLVGAWYIDPQIARVTNEEGLLCILYDDGSCEIDGLYGRGTWTVINDNKLKLTDSSGMTIDFIEEDGSGGMTIESLKDGCLTLTNSDNSIELPLYGEPVEVNQ